jgi:hypothetical protein
LESNTFKKNVTNSRGIGEGSRGIRGRYSKGTEEEARHHGRRLEEEELVV